jgi:hypothetical protein
VDGLSALWDAFHQHKPNMQGLFEGGDELGVAYGSNKPGYYQYFGGAQAQDGTTVGAYGARTQEVGEYCTWMLEAGEYIVCSFEAEDLTSCDRRPIQGTAYLFSMCCQGTTLQASPLPLNVMPTIARRQRPWRYGDADTLADTLA